MVIILEGRERTGKTTISKILKSRGFISFKDENRIGSMIPISEASRLDATLNFIIECDRRNIDLVVDRFHISEAVYCEGYRPNENKVSYTKFFDTIISQLKNTRLVYTFRNSNEDQVISDIRDVQKKINELFEYWYEKTEITNKIKINIDHMSDEEIYNTVTQRCDKKINSLYLASPFFNDEQRERENSIKGILRANGYFVYAPVENGVVKAEDDPDFANSVFRSNCEAIDRCDAVFAITDGKDMGTIWEAGYAFAKGKPVFYFAETLGSNPFNLMLAESGKGIIKTRAELTRRCVNEDLSGKDKVKYE